MTELDYRPYSTRLLAQIRDTKNIVLATCGDEQVTTRLVGHLLLDGQIVFSTCLRSFKVAQMQKNPKVAFFLDGLNIEAEASLYGHPQSYPAFTEAYGQKYPEYVSTYGYMPDDVVITAQIKKISIYVFADGKGCKDIIDFEASKAYRIEL